jgi:hypothetical protein
MADVVNRTTKQYLKSVNTPDYPSVDWIINPDLSALAGVPTKYWTITGDVITEMTQGEKDAVDAAETAARLAAYKQQLKDEFDQQNDNTKALGLLMLDLYDLIKANTTNTMPDITPAQLKTRFDNIVDGL